MQEADDLNYARLYLVDVAAARPTGVHEDTASVGGKARLGTDAADCLQPSLLVETCQTHSIVVNSEHLSRLADLDILRVRHTFCQQRLGACYSICLCVLQVA